MVSRRRCCRLCAQLGRFYCYYLRQYPICITNQYEQPTSRNRPASGRTPTATSTLTGVTLTLAPFENPTAVVVDPVSHQSVQFSEQHIPDDELGLLPTVTGDIPLAIVLFLDTSGSSTQLRIRAASKTIITLNSNADMVFPLGPLPSGASAAIFPRRRLFSGHEYHHDRAWTFSISMPSLTIPLRLHHHQDVDYSQAQRQLPSNASFMRREQLPGRLLCRRKAHLHDPVDVQLCLHPSSKTCGATRSCDDPKCARRVQSEGRLLRTVPAPSRAASASRRTQHAGRSSLVMPGTATENSTSRTGSPTAPTSSRAAGA